MEKKFGMDKTFWNYVLSRDGSKNCFMFVFKMKQNQSNFYFYFFLLMIQRDEKRYVIKENKGIVSKEFLSIINSNRK